MGLIQVLLTLTAFLPAARGVVEQGTGVATGASMSKEHVSIRQLAADEAGAAVDALADLLIDCVQGGASVSFMWPLPRERAVAFWRGVAQGVARGERLLLVAEDGAGQIVGTVQLIVDLPDNQPHRADLCKMLVHRRARRLGLAYSRRYGIECLIRAVPPIFDDLCHKRRIVAPTQRLASKLCFWLIECFIGLEGTKIKPYHSQ